jgi:hypothetical protein
MYWGGKGAPERISIKFGYELNKEHVLGGKEGFPSILHRS